MLSIQQLRPKWHRCPGFGRFHRTGLRSASAATDKEPYQFTLQSTDLNELYHYAPLLEEKVQALRVSWM